MITDWTRRADLIETHDRFRVTTHGRPDGAAPRPDNRWGFGLVRPAEALAAL